RHTFGLFLLTLALGMGFQSRRPASLGTTPAAKGQNEKIRFVDVAAQSGLRFQHVSGSPEKKYLPETFSGGVAWIDYNQDGWPDLYVCNYGRNTLYRNNGDGTFTDVTESAGVGDSRWSSSAAFADYDGDGWLDLYVVNYVAFDHKNPPAPDCQYRGIRVHCGPKGLLPAADVLYHNNGDGTFTDVTRAAGMAVAPAYGLGAVWGDFDNDGDLDLYVANDSMANFLFQNQGNGTFREIGVLAGAAYNEDGQAQAGMGVALGDYDHDGLFDYVVTNFSDDYNTLYRNLGSGVFRDVSYAAGVAFPSWRLLGWGTAFFDYDNDGWEDLFVSNGHVYPQVDQYPIDI